MQYIKIAVLIAIFSISGCGQIEAIKIEKEIRSKLSVGDPESEIIAFMESNGWVYGFNEYSRRYTARKPREEGKRRTWGITIYFYVDEEMRFKEADVVTSYTFI